MLIYIARHAWAGSFGDPAWPNDAERPLTDVGRPRFAGMVRRLVKRGFAPHRIATSPMVRCRQTAEIMVAESPGEPTVDALDALLPGSDLQALLQWTGKQNGQDVCWIGHAPDISHLTSALVGDQAVPIQFPQAACAAVWIETPADIGKGRLHWMATAEMFHI